MGRIIPYMKWKIKAMFETTIQTIYIYMIHLRRFPKPWRFSRCPFDSLRTDSASTGSTGLDDAARTLLLHQEVQHGVVSRITWGKAMGKVNRDQKTCFLMSCFIKKWWLGWGLNWKTTSTRGTWKMKLELNKNSVDLAGGWEILQEKCGNSPGPLYLL